MKKLNRKQKLTKTQQDAIASQNQSDSFQEVVKTLGQRHALILQSLHEMGGEATANEVAKYLFDKGLLPHYNTNYTSPRMVELRSKGVLEIVGKRTDALSNRKVSIYKIAIED
jgi:hypothetical protein